MRQLQDPFLFKTIRNDEYSYWPTWVDSVVYGIKTPLRKPGPRRRYTIRFEGDPVEGGQYKIVDNFNKPSCFGAKKNGYTKHMSMTYANPMNWYLPAFSGLSRNDELCVGIRIGLDDALIQRIMLGDGATYDRPYDHDSIEASRQYRESRLNNGVWHSSFQSLVDAGYSNQNKINEVMARMRCRMTGVIQIVVFTDNLQSRLLAQVRARDYCRNVNVSEVPISFYARNSGDLRYYSREQQIFDYRVSEFDSCHKLFLAHEMENFKNLTMDELFLLGPMLSKLSDKTRGDAYQAVSLHCDIMQAAVNRQVGSSIVPLLMALPASERTKYITRGDLNPFQASMLSYPEFMFLIKFIRQLNLTDAGNKLIFSHPNYPQHYQTHISSVPSHSTLLLDLVFAATFCPEHVSLKNSNQDTLLALAIYFLRPKLVKKLLDHGAGMLPTPIAGSQEFNMLRYSFKRDKQCFYVMSQYVGESISQVEDVELYINALRSLSYLPDKWFDRIYSKDIMLNHFNSILFNPLVYMHGFDELLTMILKILKLCSSGGLSVERATFFFTEAVLEHLFNRCLKTITLSPDIANQLLKVIEGFGAGAYINSTDRNGKTIAMQFAIDGNYTDLISSVKLGADVNFFKEMNGLLLQLTGLMARDRDCSDIRFLFAKLPWGKSSYYTSSDFIGAIKGLSIDNRSHMIASCVFNPLSCTQDRYEVMRATRLVCDLYRKKKINLEIMKFYFTKTVLDNVFNHYKFKLAYSRKTLFDVFTLIDFFSLQRYTCMKDPYGNTLLDIALNFFDYAKAAYLVKYFIQEKKSAFIKASFARISDEDKPEDICQILQHIDIEDYSPDDARDLLLIVLRQKMPYFTDQSASQLCKLICKAFDTTPRVVEQVSEAYRSNIVWSTFYNVIVKLLEGNSTPSSVNLLDAFNDHHASKMRNRAITVGIFSTVASTLTAGYAATAAGLSLGTAGKLAFVVSLCQLVPIGGQIALAATIGVIALAAIGYTAYATYQAVRLSLYKNEFKDTEAEDHQHLLCTAPAC